MSTRIPLEGLKNTRDLGGMYTQDGRRIVPDKLIRSACLASAAETDIQWLSGHISCIIDFRSDDERAKNPNPEIPGVEEIHLPAIRDPHAGVSREEKSEEKKSILDMDPEDLRQNLIQAYTGVAKDDFSREQYSRFIRILSEPHEKAVLWHCAGGKDRTGLAAVIIQKLLGVSEEDIMADYLLTNEFAKPEMQKVILQIEQAFGEVSDQVKKTLEYVFYAKEEYLRAFYAEAEKRYGGFQGYLRNGLGVSEEAAKKLRRMYLED